MTSRFAVLALAASCIVLGGCAATNHVPPGMADEEFDALLREELDVYWATLDLPAGTVKPDVDRIEFTTPETWLSTQVSCLREAGVDAREVSGSFTVDSAESVESRISEWICLGQYPVDGRTGGHLSEAQALYMYDYFVERLTPCLRLQGYDVPPPPSRDGYAESVRSGVFWSPYYSDDQATPHVETLVEWTRVNLRCPPLPDDPYVMYRPLGWLMVSDADPPTVRRG